MRHFYRYAALSAIAATVFLAFVCGCKKAHEPEGYRVVSYDGATQQWTIIRSGTFDGKYMKKKLVLVCLSYTWGEHESVQGPDACHLQVGRLLVPNLESDKPDKTPFITVFEMPNETLSITEGNGDDRDMQQFKIMSYTIEGR